MNTSKLREEILPLYRKTIVRSDFGSYKEETKFIKNMRGGLLNQSENKSFLNDELQFVQFRTFLVRIYEPVQENDVIEWNGHKWVVNSVITNKYFKNKEISLQVINE